MESLGGFKVYGFGVWGLGLEISVFVSWGLGLRVSGSGLVASFRI